MSRPTPSPELEARLHRLGFELASAEALAGDVSARRYFRLVSSDGTRAIAALYPPELAGAQERFVATTSLLQDAGVRVPRVLANDPGTGLMLVEDFGVDTLFDVLDPSRPREPLLEAAELARRIAGIDPARVAELHPDLDGPALAAELDQTWEVALTPHGLDRSGRIGRLLDRALSEICEHLDAAPRTPCHRDFMVRNLMRLEDGSLGVIDHQDLRLGPEGYDAASLCCDSLDCPDELRKEVRQRLGLPADRFQRLTVQRTLKIVGTFFAFAARGSTRHLALVPGALTSARRALARLPEGAPLQTGRADRELATALEAVADAASAGT